MTRKVSPSSSHVKELPAIHTLWTQDTSAFTFPKDCPHEEPFSRNGSVYAGQRPIWVGRGTRSLVASESQTRQNCNDAWCARPSCQSDTNTDSPLLLGLCTVPNPRQCIRAILDPARRPLYEFPSTHAFIAYVLHAVLAHKAAYALLADENRPEISLGSIVFAQAPDGGRLVDWDLAQSSDDHQTKIYIRTSTRHLLAARLCSETPPPRTVGDDVESFVLLLLWMAARYAPNNMNPASRGNVLAKFEAEDGTIKRDMICVGTATVVGMKLLSSDLSLVLEDVIDMFHWRYRVLRPRDENNAKAVEELGTKQALLESHEWLIDILSEALRDEAWATVIDGSRKEQTVERPDPVLWIRGLDLF